MNRKNTILLFFTLFMGLPSMAYANAGTALMWAAIFHLFIGNAIIGIFEGFLIAKVFNLKFGKSIGLLVLANYFSAWIGILVLGPSISGHLHLDLYNIRIWFGILVLVAYVSTIILEWPFIAICFRGTVGWFRNSLWASIIVQTLSYLLLIGWYWMSSGTSLLLNMNIVQPSEMRLPEKVLVYYISAKDGNVYLRHWSKENDQKVFTLNSSDEKDRLFARASENDSRQSDIVARLETHDRRKPSLTVVQSSLSDILVRGKGDGKFYFGNIPLLDASESSAWEVSTRFWSTEGMSGTNRKTGKKFHFALATPFASWSVENAVLLPDNKVLFQLGRDQICLLELNTNRVALIIKGRGPLPVMERKHKKIEQEQSTRSLRSG